MVELQYYCCKDRVWQQQLTFIITNYCFTTVTTGSAIILFIQNC